MHLLVLSSYRVYLTHSEGTCPYLDQFTSTIPSYLLCHTRNCTWV